VPRDSGISIAQAEISADSTTAAWMEFSRPSGNITWQPLRLVLFHVGEKPVEVEGVLPIWQWAFSSRGGQFALRESPELGSPISHYELHDSASGARLEQVDIDDSTGGEPPAWAHDVMVRKKKAVP
jgi:hypothetical protein